RHHVRNQERSHCTSQQACGCDSGPHEAGWPTSDGGATPHLPRWKKAGHLPPTLLRRQTSALRRPCPMQVKYLLPSSTITLHAAEDYASCIKEPIYRHQVRGTDVQVVPLEWNPRGDGAQRQ